MKRLEVEVHVNGFEKYSLTKKELQVAIDNQFIPGDYDSVFSKKVDQFWYPAYDKNDHILPSNRSLYWTEKYYELVKHWKPRLFFTIGDEGRSSHGYAHCVFFTDLYLVVIDEASHQCYYNRDSYGNLFKTKPDAVNIIPYSKIKNVAMECEKNPLEGSSLYNNKVINSKIKLKMRIDFIDDDYYIFTAFESNQKGEMFRSGNFYINLKLLKRPLFNENKTSNVMDKLCENRINLLKDRAASLKTVEEKRQLVILEEENQKKNEKEAEKESKEKNRKMALVITLMLLLILTAVVSLSNRPSGSSDGEHRCAICGTKENLWYLRDDGEYYCKEHFDNAFYYYHGNE